MHPFSFIFTPEFDYQKIVQHMNIVGDVFDGIGQLLIVEVDRENINTVLLGIFQAMVGSVEEPGLILAAFQFLFNEAVYEGLGGEEHIRTQKGIKRQQHISVSIFSTEGTTNKFMDLVVGQKLAFFSKKDMEEHKNFYDKQIKQLREFLITLKLAITRYGECCREGDPIVFRICVNSYDELQ